MLKRALIVVGVATAALALAVTVVQGAHGRGAASNDRGQSGHFRMDVKKFIGEKRTEVGGDFLWEGTDTAAHARLRIYMRHAHEFVKDGHIGRFNGRAVMNITRDGRTHTFEGVVRVTAIDNRDPTAPHPGTTPDALAFQFTTPTSNFSYSFEGRVREGDIKVYERHHDE